MDIAYLMIAQQQGPESVWQTVVMLGVIFLIFWFLVLRPQKKQLESHQKFINALKKGDKVVTAGGLFGTVKSVDNKVVELEISRGTKIKISRQKIQQSQEELLADDDHGGGDDDSDEEDGDDTGKKF